MNESLYFIKTSQNMLLSTQSDMHSLNLSLKKNNDTQEKAVLQDSNEKLI